MSPRRLVAVVAAATAFAAALWLLPAPHALLDELARLRGAGWSGGVRFASVYLVATLAFVPAGILQGAAGFLYGPWLGFLVAWPLGTACGAVSFALARTALRGWVEARLHERFRPYDRAIARRGAVAVALLRISPLSPFNAMHYALGVTGVTVQQFAVGTLLGSIPPCLLFTYVGSTVAELGALADGDAAASLPAQIVGLTTTLAASVGITVIARRELARMRAGDDASG
jgi:uncharacterized membrane protein YdjX (TVP38/TMEM64 family)